MASFAKSRPAGWAGVIGLVMAAFAMVLLIYVAACSVIIEFTYRRLIAAPIEWLRAHLVPQTPEM